MREFPVNKYSGIPFVDKGRTVKGADCWGLIREIYRIEFGITLPSLTAGYTSVSSRDEMDNVVAKEWKNWINIDIGREEPGDVIILRIMGLPIHLGIVLTGRRMLHTLKGMDAAIEHYDSRVWEKRVVGFARRQEIENGNS